MTEVLQGHFVRIKYHSPTDRTPARAVASWTGWPSDNGRTVSKRLADYDNAKAMAAQAAQLYCDWLSEGTFDHTVTSATLASMGPDQWALIVKTKVSEKA